MSELTHVLRHMLPVDDPNALVGHATGDDAAVYRISEDRALVVTADFFTPIVDDGYDFGRIAAANAFSDVYAMGGRPLFALNLVGFPRKLLPDGILEEILRGGSEVAREAGVPILGGHTIDDAEPKYGMVAVGEVDPGTDGHERRCASGRRARAHQGARLRRRRDGHQGRHRPDDVIASAVESMATLNRGAAEAMVAAEVRAGTDVTGFGLLGHLRSMLRASGVAAHIRGADVPMLSGAGTLLEAGHVPGGTKRNLRTSPRT
jgi:selenide, water dikinase